MEGLTEESARLYLEYVNRNCRIEHYSIALYKTGQMHKDKIQDFFTRVQYGQLPSDRNWWVASMLVNHLPN